MKLLGQNFYKCLGNFPNKQEKNLKELRNEMEQSGRKKNVDHKIP